MSIWTDIKAEFTYVEPPEAWQLEHIRRQVPQGSESGPDVNLHGLTVFVTGNLRDVDDDDSPAFLAWFVRTCQFPSGILTASLVIDVDFGPRYRYEWADGKLTKLRGVLDL